MYQLNLLYQICTLIKSFVSNSAQSEDEMYGGYFTNRVLMEVEMSQNVQHLFSLFSPSHKKEGEKKRESTVNFVTFGYCFFSLKEVVQLNKKI